MSGKGKGSSGGGGKGHGGSSGNSGSTGGRSSSGGSSEGGSPQIVEGYRFHGYSGGTRGDSSRYAYIGKNDSGVPEFIDYGPKR